MGNSFIHKCLSGSYNVPGPELGPEAPAEIKQTMSFSFGIFSLLGLREYCYQGNNLSAGHHEASCLARAPVGNPRVPFQDYVNLWLAFAANTMSWLTRFPFRNLSHLPAQ